VTTSEATDTLTYDVFVNDPPPQDNGLLPNGEPKQLSPQASTLIYGSGGAVLTDPPMTADQARALGDWVAGKGRNLTDIFIPTATATTGSPPGCWQSGSGAASSPRRGRSRRCTTTSPCGRCSGTRLRGNPANTCDRGDGAGQPLQLEGHELVIVEVGHTDSDDTTVLHVPISHSLSRET
jgi:hypothetical protein